MFKSSRHWPKHICQCISCCKHRSRGSRIRSPALPKFIYEAVKSLNWVKRSFVRTNEELLELGQTQPRRVEHYFGKTILSTPDLDSNLDLPVIGRLIHCESDALDYEATKSFYTKPLAVENIRSKVRWVGSDVAERFKALKESTSVAWTKMAVDSSQMDELGPFT
uniref:Uncharacterized protein n=1 Tax=Timema monikensis TaxID=170555 RepID=A0A7R9DXF4_9NEOP|nr:unnamed protein product [Timema monikensis]